MGVIPRIWEVAVSYVLRGELRNGKTRVEAFNGFDAERRVVADLDREAVGIQAHATYIGVAEPRMDEEDD